MNTLKQVIKYPNANAIEATWVDEEGVNVKVTAYSDEQMDLFRADVAAYGGDIAEYEALIAEVEAEWAAQPVPTPLPAPAPEALPVTVTLAEWDALCDAAKVPQLKKGKK